MTSSHFPLPPNPTEIEKWFLKTPEVDPGTFEFALVLGGTVSAGAYTAGAVDFLIEALDCFTEAKNSGLAPKHKVILKLIAGTSGGGVNAAIAARTLGFALPHVHKSTPIVGTTTGNPFYDVWVNTLRLDRFLDTSDIAGVLPSFLNGEPIDDGAAQIAQFANGAPVDREWVSGPLRIILTVTNLRGIPYRIDLGNNLGQTYVDHADYMRYAVLYPSQQLEEPRPDESVLPLVGDRAVPQSSTWADFSLAARATAAFPLGFPARVLKRPTNHYRYRLAPYPGFPDKPDSYVVRTPDWEEMQPAEGGDLPDQWDFLAVDGGATNNEPIQLARTALAGLLQRNPRDPNLANRAVWLIDPFAGKAALGPSKQTSFANQLGAIASTLTQQTRYDTADLLMATDNNIFSRFMLTPTRNAGGERVALGEDAIASAGLGAFIGFACPEFMRFDYLLGRQNCQKFLREEFVLGKYNAVFKDWTEKEKEKFEKPTGPDRLPMLPIIPLFGAAAVDVEMDDWPKGKLDPEKYRDLIEARFRAVFQFELGGDIGKSALAWIGAHVTQKQAADYLINAINDYLVKVQLK